MRRRSLAVVGGDLDCHWSVVCYCNHVHFPSVCFLLLCGAIAVTNGMFIGSVFEYLGWLAYFLFSFNTCCHGSHFCEVNLASFLSTPVT